MLRKNIALGGFIATVVVVLFTVGPYQQTTEALDSSVIPDVSSKTNSVMARAEYSIEQQSLTLAQIFEQTEQGVVSIAVQKPTRVFSTNGEGSGLVYDKAGYIITNNHVVDGAMKIIVTFIDGSSYVAKIVGKDPFTDLAVIKIDIPSSDLSPLKLGDSSKSRVGEQVAAIGNPFGLSGSMTSGIISQLGRNLPSQGTGFLIPDVIQTDAAINPGNSGGPLLNMYGEVIGINTAIYSKTGDFSGVGFSIPSNTVSKIIPILIEEGKYDHPWVGITSVDVDPDLADVLELDRAKGIQVMSVMQGSPAAKAGIKGSSIIKEVDGIEYTIGGDIILAIDGNEVRKIDDVLIHLQREKSVSDKVIFKILRDGNIIDVVVTLDKRPE